MHLFMSFDEEEFYLPPSSEQLKERKRAMLRKNSQNKKSTEDIPSGDVLPKSSKSSNNKKAKKYPPFKRVTNNANDQISNNGNANSQNKTPTEDVRSGYISQESGNNGQYKIRETERNIKNTIREIEQDIEEEQFKIANELKQQTLNIGKNQDSKHYQLMQNIINRMQSMPHFLQYHLNQEHIQNLIAECQIRLDEIEAGKNPFRSTHFIPRTTDTDRTLIPILKTFLQKSKLCLQQKLYAQQLEDTMTMIDNEKMLMVIPSDTAKYSQFCDYFIKKYTVINNQTSALTDLMQKYERLGVLSEKEQNSLSNNLLTQQNKLLNFMNEQRYCCENASILSRKRGGKLVDIFNPNNNNFFYSDPILYAKDMHNLNYSDLSNTLNTSYTSHGYVKF